MMTSGPWLEPGLADGGNAREPYENLFRTLFDAIPSSILLVDSRLRIAMANRNFLQKGNRTPRDTIGHRFEDVFPPTIVERTRILDCVRRVFERNEQSPSQRMTFRAPGVPMRTYYFRALPFNWNDQVQYALFLMEDITEQVRLSQDIQRVERHLASVVESASDILLSTDNRGRILSWNKAAERLTGYQACEAIGRRLPEFFAPADRPEIEQALGGGPAMAASRTAEWALTTLSEERIAVSWTLAPMLNADGETTGMVAAGRDLTERHRLEAQLLQSQKLAALGVMAGGIAHEIRNPLAVCSSAAQFLLDEDLAPDLRRECVQKTIAGVHKASEIIENLLRFARPAGGDKMTRVDPLALLTQALSVVNHQAHLNQLDVETQFCEQPLWVRGVPSLLEQAFINILLNAIASMPNGGLLTLTLDRDGDEVLVHVIDTGVGIDAADIGKIFDPFYTRSPVGKGTGLGLSICYSIIQQHHGRIEVESAPGIGTCFVVHLPLA
ncbi:PAS domain-containing protein [Candidatus Thiodictyon syntrophicum]|jgi:PAS domain S-box-containing protein|nr:PAS domain-containing protein [Candidatus Thiodictyon syntrophicum]